MLPAAIVRGALSRPSLRERLLLPAQEWLAGLCYLPPSAGADGRVDPQLRLWFQRFLSIKLLCMFHLLWAWAEAGRGWLHVVASTATSSMNTTPLGLATALWPGWEARIAIGWALLALHAQSSPVGGGCPEPTGGLSSRL